MARRRDYENLFQRDPSWSWRGALRRLAIGVGAAIAIALAFGLVFWVL